MAILSSAIGQFIEKTLRYHNLEDGKITKTVDNKTSGEEMQMKSFSDKKQIIHIKIETK